MKYFFWVCFKIHSYDICLWTIRLLTFLLWTIGLSNVMHFFFFISLFSYTFTALFKVFWTVNTHSFFFYLGEKFLIIFFLLYKKTSFRSLRTVAIVAWRPDASQVFFWRMQVGNCLWENLQSIKSTNSTKCQNRQNLAKCQKPLLLWSSTWLWVGVHGPGCESGLTLFSEFSLGYQNLC